MVATLDEREKVQVEVSTDWCVAVEHWRLSSMMLWQPLDTKSNDHTTSKSLKADI